MEQVWMPSILALFGTLIVVSFTACLNTRAVTAQIDALRAEVKGDIQALRAEVKGDIQSLRAETRQGFAELEMRLTMQISELSRRVERLEEQRGLVRP